MIAMAASMAVAAMMSAGAVASTAAPATVETTPTKKAATPRRWKRGPWHKRGRCKPNARKQIAAARKKRRRH